MGEEWRRRAVRLLVWLREDPAGQFALVWMLCVGCAGVGYMLGQRDSGRG